MHKIMLAAACLISTINGQAASIRFDQSGWSTGATLHVAFSGEDSDGNGAITQPELSVFGAVWISPLGHGTNWTLAHMEAGDFSFTDLTNYAFFVQNPEFSLVSNAFEGEVSALVFDSLLFPVDSTATPPTGVPEPGGLAVAGLAALVICRRWRRVQSKEAEAA